MSVKCKQKALEEGGYSHNILLMSIFALFEDACFVI